MLSSSISSRAGVEPSKRDRMPILEPPDSVVVKAVHITAFQT